MPSVSRHISQAPVSAKASSTAQLPLSKSKTAPIYPSLPPSTHPLIQASVCSAWVLDHGAHRWILIGDSRVNKDESSHCCSERTQTGITAHHIQTQTKELGLPTSILYPSLTWCGPCPCQLPMPTCPHALDQRGSEWPGCHLQSDHRKGTVCCSFDVSVPFENIGSMHYVVFIIMAISYSMITVTVSQRHGFNWWLMRSLVIYFGLVLLFEVVGT